MAPLTGAAGGRALAVAVAALAILAAPAAAREYRLHAFGDNRDAWFEVEGFTGRNPTLPVEPGEDVTLHVHVEGPGFHNLYVGPPVGRHVECCFPPGADLAVNFTVPAGATGRIEYSCQAHSVRGMAGFLELPGPPDAPAPSPGPQDPGDGGGSSEGAPGPALPAALAALAAAALLRPRCKG